LGNGSFVDATASGSHAANILSSLRVFYHLVHFFQQTHKLTRIASYNGSIRKCKYNCWMHWCKKTV